jgi:hypothetical protein
MAGLISTAALAIVVIAAMYLLALGGAALVRPEYARQFLGAHATTRTLHFTESGLRILAGAAFIITAPHAAFTPAFLLLGWVLVASSVALAIVPWRLHQRFAAWSVPQAMHYLPLIGVASIACGLGLIAAVVLPRAAG